MYNLLKKDISFNWGKEEEASFQKIKKHLTTTPIMAYPNFKQPFLLYTDASYIGLGAILSQEDDQGKEKVISYLSRSLSIHEKNYSAIKIEYLAIIFTIKKLRSYLYS